MIKPKRIKGLIGLLVVAVACLLVMLPQEGVQADDPPPPNLRVREGVKPYFDPVLGVGAELAHVNQDGTPYVPGPTEKIIIIMVKFPDPVDFKSGYTQSYYNSLVFGTGINDNSMYNYYQEVSYGQMAVVGSVYGPFTLPNSLTYYAYDTGGEIDGNTSYNLIIDAVTVADASVDFTQYDTDADGYVDHVMVVHAAEDQSAGADPNTSIWPMRWSKTTPGDYFTIADGKKVGWGTILPYAGQVGVFAHEFSHDIGNPDLYDYDSGYINVDDDDQYPVSDWCLMAGGSWGKGDGSNPTHLCGYLKWRTGWITPTILSSPQSGVIVKEIETNNDAQTLYKIPIATHAGGEEEFLLIENRNANSATAKYDKWDSWNIPAWEGNPAHPTSPLNSGLIIMHIDERYLDQWGKLSNDGPPTYLHYSVWVEDPGFINEITYPYETKINAIYSSNSGHTSFTPYTSPNSNSNDGQATDIFITNISAAGPTMTFDLGLPTMPTPTPTSTPTATPTPPGFEIYLPLILKNYAPVIPTPTPTPTQPAATPTPTATKTATPTVTPTPTEGAPKVLVANSRNRSIYIIDPATDTAQGPFLRPLGKGTALLDVVVTPDGRTALISNFDGNIIYFIDLTAPRPVELGSVLIGFSAEDIALSPDGRWALVTDGGASAKVASIDVVNRRRVQTLVGPRAQAVAVAADGETVLVVDTDRDRVRLLHLNPEDGELTYAGQYLRTGDAPINVAISPDGRTALVANFWDDTVTVLRIDGPGNVVRIGELGGLPRAQQSIAFSPDGRKAYVVSVDPDPDQLSVLNVNGPGDITDSGIRIDLHTDTSCGFYGIDCLAVSPDGRKAYAGNPCVWEEERSIDEVTVIDLIDYHVIGQIPVGRYPVGIAFFTSREPLSE